MSYLGEFSRNSSILLELLTKDEQNQPISVDSTPIATIEHYSANGVQIMDRVTLNTASDESKYTYLYQIPSAWPYGTYIIRYQVQIQGETYTTEETFQLSQSDDLVERDTQLTDLLDGSEGAISPSVIEQASSQADYVYPSDFQLEADIRVEGKQLIITPKTPLKHNHTYTIVLKSAIQSVDGNKLGEDRIIQFTTSYLPLYAEPLELKSVLKQLFSMFSLPDIYAALRNAGQKAHQLLRMQANANHSDFEMLSEDDSSYFSVTRFVVYEASRQLLSNLYMQLIERSSPFMNQQDLIMTGFKLGDFEVNSNQGQGEGDDDYSSILSVAKTLMDEIDREIKYWTDALMGRNARGYARPISAVTRSSATAPESRDI